MKTSFVKFIGFFTIRNSLIIAGLVFWVTFIASPIKPKPFGDDVWNNEAKIIAGIIKGDIDASELKFKHSILPTLYYLPPALLTGGDGHSKGYLIAGIVWNFIFYIIALLLYFRLVNKYAGQFGLFIMLLSIIVIPYFSYYQLGFLSEPLSFFLVAVIIYYYDKYLIYKTTALLVAWIIPAGLLLANRPNFIAIVPLLLLFSILLKKKYFAFAGVGILVIFFGVNLFYKLQTTIEKKDNAVFLLEQIHVGQFPLRKEFTDWSFFNNEFRANSIDYKEYDESRSKISQLVTIDSVDKKKALIDEIIYQMSENPMASILLPFKKIIHGNSLHVGSTIPGPLTIKYIKQNPVLFLINLTTNIFNWVLIFFAIIFFIKQKSLAASPFLLYILIIISFVAFNSVSASEQRYLFPVKVLFIIPAAMYFSSLYNNFLKRSSEIEN